MRTSRMVVFAVLVDHWVELNESEKRDNYLDLARELKKHKSDSEPNSNWCAP